MCKQASRSNKNHVGGTRGRSWLGYYATSQKAARSNSDEVGFFNLPNPSSRTMVLGSTQPGGKGRPARKADSLTAIFEPIV
jgi:hypothetical protein